MATKKEEKKEIPIPEFFNGDIFDWIKTTGHQGPVGLSTKYYVKSGCIIKFREVMDENIEFTKKEAGVRVYKLNADYKDWQNVFWMIEEWESAAHLLKHCTSETFIMREIALSDTMEQPFEQGLYTVME